MSCGWSSGWPGRRRRSLLVWIRVQLLLLLTLLVPTPAIPATAATSAAAVGRRR